MQDWKKLQQLQTEVRTLLADVIRASEAGIRVAEKCGDVEKPIDELPPFALCATNATWYHMIREKAKLFELRVDV